MMDGTIAIDRSHTVMGSPIGGVVAARHWYKGGPVKEVSWIVPFGVVLHRHCNIRNTDSSDGRPETKG